ncbi:hypothetical protein [Mucilaginibacter rubeus]|uniref:Uncharacterized protein n=1 Tax=Mucilaginibacter rubeus TaxID=2027860 RepID=A0A5C1I550_9SPHI|nr:hypothetical protein [Mucilaginibacter rubeus]QEM12986.1 hypothetical protein DEO27_024230 [Mucilaginibacter rubeus]
MNLTLSQCLILKIFKKCILRCSFRYVILVAFITNSCFAQNGNLKLSDLTAHQKNSKVYLHFDRDNYAPGDTAWFKAYLVEGGNTKWRSKNFYLEVYTGDGHMRQRITAPIFESTASGSIILPDTGGLKGVYCRAYTAQLLKETAGNGYITRIPVMYTGTHQATQDSTVANPHFLPEGGDWINGLPSLVAFSFTDNNDIPVNIKGVVKCDDKVLVNFETSHDGMGNMTMLPEAGKDYIAEWKTADGLNHSVRLPERKSRGVAMHVNDLKDGKKFFVYRTKTVEENNKNLVIIATIDGNQVYEAKISLSESEAVNGVIPLKGLPTGIMEIKLLNADRVPIAARLTFVNNFNYKFDVDTQFVAVDKRKRTLNKIRLFVSDTIRSNISVSVSDYSSSGHFSRNGDIISSLLLTGDLRGKIINPYYYFSEGGDKANELDLVMLTHGWRKYNWADSVEKQKISSLVDHNYLTISGNVNAAAKSRDGFSGLNMNVIVQAADSSSVLVPVKTDKSGAFFKDGLIFYGDAKLYFRLPEKSIETDLHSAVLNNGLIDSAQTLRKELRDEQFQLIGDNRNVSAIPVVHRTHNNVKALKEVKITAKAITENQKVDETYTLGIFSGGISKNFNIGNDKKALNFVSLFQYLLGKIPGLEISNPVSLTPSASWRGRVSFFLNNQKSSASDIRNIGMEEFDYVKVYDPAAGGIFGAYAGVIAVYTKKGKGYNFNNQDNKYNTLRGYSPPIAFYSPEYATAVNLGVPDVRKTLYWNPNIIFDKRAKEYIIQFYNNDLAEKFKLVLEGINSEGKLAHIEKVF